MIVNTMSMETSTNQQQQQQQQQQQPELEDINRALYDLGAQDLLDVWEAMDSEVNKQPPVCQSNYSRLRL